MKTTVLFRKSLAEENEFNICSKYLHTTESRINIENSLVIAKYSALPFYQELENDLKLQGSKLINSYEQHLYLANINNWYIDLSNFTPQTWNNFIDIPKNVSGPFILKGNTNSRKALWKTHMFANSIEDAKRVFNNLLDDAMIGEQGVVVRKFENLINYGNDLVGIPISKEFRFFVLNNIIISGGFYWSNYIEDIGYIPDHKEVPIDFLNEVISCVGNKANFYTIDVAQKINGEWIVIELNDGQQSGLGCNDPEILYNNIKENLCMT